LTRTSKRLSLLFIVAVTFLAACGSEPANSISLPTLTVAAPTWTDTPAPVTDTPSPTETATPEPTSTATPSGVVNLMAVGDIMLGRTVGEQAQAQGSEIVFAGVQSVFDSADVLVGNLECALTSGGEQQHKTFTFAAPPEAARALALAGFDVLSLANNHAMDFGSQGLFDTFDNLGQNGIASVGAGANAAEAHAPVILERNGLRLAFLAYTDVPKENSGFDTHSWIATDSQPGIAWADTAQITADVSAAKAQADVVIVQLHAGHEVNAYIHPITSGQQAEAHAAIDAGAALVIGSHPHILQRLELYHGGLIAYSLGNFVFDDFLGVANDSVILRVTLTHDGLQSYDWLPVTIKNGLPGPAFPDEASAIGTMVAPMASSK